ncbi:MAG: hypothetical protein ACR2MQ_12590 [Gemmatimonadaceae bacterium]
MKLIPPSVHRALDLVTVAIFALAPIFLHLSGPPAMLSYALAVIHMLLTLATKFPDVGKRPIALKLHGLIELVVGIVLLVLPWVVGWTGTARTYYTVMGVIILVVWALSKYEHAHKGE